MNNSNDSGDDTNELIIPVLTPSDSLHFVKVNNAACATALDIVDILTKDKDIQDAFGSKHGMHWRLQTVTNGILVGRILDEQSEAETLDDGVLDPSTLIARL